jgi:trehalose 6-phosphate phosphatase
VTRHGFPPAPREDRAYFFDIDGTLAEVAPTPAEARVERKIAEAIVRIFEATGGAVALVTGRSLVAADAIFDVRRLPVAAQHGLERRRADGFIERRPADPLLLRRLRSEIDEAFSGHLGVVIEDKGASIAIHYRAVPTAAPAVHTVARRIADELGPGVSVLRGKRVVELTVGEADKGLAVREFLAERPFRGRIPVFVGDDVSDEAAFEVVNELGGTSIKVGPGETLAQWRLRGVADVSAWVAGRA